MLCVYTAINAHFQRHIIAHILQLTGLNEMHISERCCLQIGPGVVYLVFDWLNCKCAMLQHLTPTEPLMQKLVHNMYAARSIPAPMAKLLMIGEAMQVKFTSNGSLLICGTVECIWNI